MQKDSFVVLIVQKKKKIKLKDKEKLKKQIKRGQEFEDQSFVLLEKEIF